MNKAKTNILCSVELDIVTGTISLVNDSSQVQQLTKIRVFADCIMFTTGSATSSLILTYLFHCFITLAYAILFIS